MSRRFLLELKHSRFFGKVFQGPSSGVEFFQYTLANTGADGRMSLETVDVIEIERFAKNI